MEVKMKIGTKSLLFGVHTWFIHPFFVAKAWNDLYGWYPDHPYRPFPQLDLFKYWVKLWVCFFVHDWGYWGKKEMDGPEGDKHPEVGAGIAHSLLDRVLYYEPNGPHSQIGDDYPVKDTEWYKFCLYHSRFYAKSAGAKPSKLCIADKLAMAYYPTWLFVFLATITGEIKDYMSDKSQAKHQSMGLDYSTPRTFTRTCAEYLRKYAHDHKDGKEDLETPLPGIKPDPLSMACLHAHHYLKGDGAIKDNMFGESLPARVTVTYEEIRSSLNLVFTDPRYIQHLPKHIQEQVHTLWPDNSVMSTIMSQLLDVMAIAVLDTLVKAVEKERSE